MKSHQNEPARIVSLSSVGSLLSAYPSALQDRFRNPQNSFADLDHIAAEFLVSYQIFTILFTELLLTAFTL